MIGMLPADGGEHTKGYNLAAGFIVALTGDIMTMPGLPKVPAAEHMDVDSNGSISGLF